jgi:protein-S-isoprenylcysteine O-methyltransferase Ste14
MGKFWASIGSLIFFVIAPGTLAGFLPWAFTHWQMRPGFFHLYQIRPAGIALIFLGLVPLVASFARFVFEGLGTPAPIAPPKHLVVGGFYRYVRNPMYVGVVSAIFGQVLLFGDVRLLWYGAAVWLGFHLFVLVYEEPTLRGMFGEEYKIFCANVPRWVPRLTPWNANAKV